MVCVGPGLFIGPCAVLWSAIVTLFNLLQILPAAFCTRLFSAPCRFCTLLCTLRENWGTLRKGLRELRLLQPPDLVQPWSSVPQFSTKSPPLPPVSLLYIYYLVLGNCTANSHLGWGLFAKGVPFCEQDANKMQSRYEPGMHMVASCLVLI